MWRLNNNTPFQAERIFMRNRDGAEHWVVTIKGTFDIYQSTCVGAVTQEPILMAPSYYGDPASTSLIYDGDFILTSAGTDVLLNGNAYADLKKGGTFCETVLSIDNLMVKRLHVYGQRFWERSLMGGLSVSPAVPFETIPLRYERAYGGCIRTQSNEVVAFEAANPVGRGLTINMADAIGQPLPNFEYPHQQLTNWQQKVPPACYAPIAGSWAPRVHFAGTYDQDWQRNRCPLPPVNFDERYYRCAPIDQQLNRYLRGGEWVTLTNLSKHGTLRFKLPKVHFKLTTLMEGKKIHHRASCFRLILEPDVPRLIMLWQAALPCHGRDHLLEETKIDIMRQINKGAAT